MSYSPRIFIFDSFSTVKPIPNSVALKQEPSVLQQRVTSDGQCSLWIGPKCDGKFNSRGVRDAGIVLVPSRAFGFPTAAVANGQRLNGFKSTDHSLAVLEVESEGRVPAHEGQQVAPAPDCFLASARCSLEASARCSLEASDPSAHLSPLCPRSQLVLFLFCSHIGSHQSRSFTETPLQSPSVMSGPGDSDMMDVFGEPLSSRPQQS